MVMIRKHTCLYLSELIQFIHLDIQIMCVASVYLVDLETYVVVFYYPPAYDYAVDE